MPSLTLPDRLIWFAHCPKTGGTSVEQLMVSRWGNAVDHLHWGWDLWWRRGGWRMADPPNSPQHLIWQDAVKQLPQMPDVVFAVVRDPVARMESEYRWQRRHRRGTRLGRVLAHLPFGIWLRLMLAVVRINPYAFDNHFRPQSDFVPENATVFRLEAGLSPIAAWLSEVTGEPMPDAAMPHAIPSGGEKVCSLENADLIAEAFAEDYDRFRYPRPKVPGRAAGLGDRIAEWAAVVVAWLERHGRL